MSNSETLFYINRLVMTIKGTYLKNFRCFLFIMSGISNGNEIKLLDVLHYSSESHFKERNVS